MSRLSDRLFELESALDRNKGDEESDILSRRMGFRKVLTEWGEERWNEGYRDGRQDVWDARLAAGQAQRDREAAEETSDG
jgi:hypothetical protein